MDYLKTLETSISEVGYWRWWTADLPEYIQLEFGGVQLWQLPPSAGDPPPSVYALRFEDVGEVYFLTKEGSSLASDWPTALHEDRIEPFSVDYDAFTLTEEDLYREIIAGTNARLHFKGSLDLGMNGEQVILAFRGGDAGVAVRARRMFVASHSGPLSPKDVIEAYKKWWEYWKEYWNRKDSSQPLPVDYACEATIPQDKFKWRGR